MKYLQKCCRQCPGRIVTSKDNQEHECCLPKYVSGNFKVSSLKKHVPGCPVRKKLESTSGPKNDERMSCYDKFAMAKKLHAENLQHQPLPDKVNDAVFKNVGKLQEIHEKRLLRGKYSQGVEDGKEGEQARRFGPVLGCKNSPTRMDLAICWETPTDPLYEPKRPVHVDGSNGGAAPAIFTLVQQTPTATKVLCGGTNKSRTEFKEQKVAKNCSCKNCDEQGDANEKLQSQIDEKNPSCCCECLCENLSSVDISKPGRADPSKSCRKCVACERKNLGKVNDQRVYDPRLVRSAVRQGDDETSSVRRNGLPPKATIPRPKTPFARRSFCIDSLAPPFSVVNGCRDADYPEHWRLMTVYQQSYRNPKKQRGTFRR